MDIDYKYKLVKNWRELNQLITYCKITGYCSSDFETTGTNAMYPGSKPTILGVAFQPGSAWVIPLSHNDSVFINEWEEVLKYFGREVIEDPNIVKIGQNIKYEMAWWRKYGITMQGRVFDTMLAKYLLDEERPHGLKEMVTRFLPEYSRYDLQGKPGQKATVEQLINFWSNVPLKELSKYCALDSDLTFRLYIFFEPRLIELGFYPLFRNMLMMASRVLMEVEFHGMNVDRDYLENLMDVYKEKIEDCEKSLRKNPFLIKYEKAKQNRIKKEMVDGLKLEIEEIKKTGGSAKTIATREKKITNYLSGIYITKKDKDKTAPTNFNSPKQMIEFLFMDRNGFQFEVVKYTEDKNKRQTDTPSTDEEVLLELANWDDTGFIKSLLELRGLTKLNSTYIVGMWEKLNINDKIHGSWLLHGTVCIGENTPLLTNKGKIIIRDIIPKQKSVLNIEHLGLEILTHNRRFKRITHTVNKGYHNMVEITTDDGYKQECTPKHLLYTPNGWVSTKECFEKGLNIYIYKLPDLKPLPITIKPIAEAIKPIEEFPGYFVSNMGNVFTDKIEGSRGKRGSNKFLMSCRITNKYRRVGLRLNTGKKYNFKVATLVYTTFIGGIPKGYSVDHVNCNKLDDYITNLQLLTKMDNFNRAFNYNIKAHSRNLTHNQTFKTSKIISYKRLGKRLVCDISVEDDQSYIANGLINHNTGRLSSRNPNLQNIPRDTTSSDIKKMFIAPPGKLIFQLDYSQAELRVLAAAAKEETMIEWFKTGKDIHLASACLKWDKNYDEVLKIYSDESHPDYIEWKIKRKQAKTINFGIVYGQTAKKLSATLSSEEHQVSLVEAQDFLDNFNIQFPQITKFIKRQEKYAIKNGYVFNIFGRKRRLPNVESDNWGKKAEALRQAVNAPIQGAASDFALFSSVLIREQKLLENLPIDLDQVGTVHDSLIYYIDPKDIHKTFSKLFNICKNPETKTWFNFELKDIEMKVDFEIGTNWQNLQGYDKQVDYTKWVDLDTIYNKEEQ